MKGAGAIRPRYAEVNVEQARGVIREMDAEQAERGMRHYQAGLTKVKAEIAALPQEARGLLANLCAHQANLECLLDECRQRIDDLEQALAVGRNLEKFMQEARFTQSRLAAEATNGDTKALRAHIRGTRRMRPDTQQIYERVLSKKLGRDISLDQ
jgi:predicted RNase H-like nuclease (RuvC/YqgF family)